MKMFVKIRKNIFDAVKFSMPIFFILFSFQVFAKNAIPELEKPITDIAEIIDEETKSKLNEYLIEEKDKSGLQVAVLIVPNLDGEPIENFSMRVCEAWRLGRKGEDNGVLLLVAIEDHKLRIEVGYGLEGILTDMKCGQIIRDEITPCFKNEAYSEGIKKGVSAIVEIATKSSFENENSTTDDPSENRKKSKSRKFPVFMLPLTIFFCWFTLIILLATDSFRRIFCLITGRPYKKRAASKNSENVSDDESSSSDCGSDDSYSDESDSDDGGSYDGDGGDFGGGGASGDW